MDQPYSVWADALSKFHTAPEWIQALWLVSFATTVLGSVFLIARAVTALVSTIHGRRETLPGYSLDAIDRSADGLWVFYAHRAVRDMSRVDAAGDDLAGDEGAGYTMTFRDGSAR